MRILILAVALLLIPTFVASQESGGFTPTIENLGFEAKASGGFNYDLLRNPLDVSFDQPKGYVGFNMPFKFVLPKKMMQDMFKGVSDLMTEDGDEFEPKGTARQHANVTFQVDVPMFGGVGSFGNTQNMYLHYENVLGAPEMTIPVESDQMNLFLRGAINVPLNLTLGWETMTFGYAYKFNDKLRVALSLHRHTFHFDLGAKVDVDLLGYMRISGLSEGADGGSSPLGAQRPQTINYSSEQMYGTSRGRYEVAAWSPTLAIKFWRLSWVSRFGVNTRAEGELNASYSLPIFLTRDFQPQDDEFFLENQERIRKNETHSFRYTCSEDLIWKIPSGHTMSFDIVKEKLSFSYTKIAGDIEMRLPDIVENVRSQETGMQQSDTIAMDLGVTVDHILMLNGNFDHAFFSLGVFGMDFRWDEQKELMEQIEGWPGFGGGMLLPVLTFGTTMGAKMRLLLEVDLLPLSAVKTGVVYFF